MSSGPVCPDFCFSKWICICGAVMKHHMIKGHRCDVRKALSKEEMRDSRFSGGGSYYVV